MVGRTLNIGLYFTFGIKLLAILDTPLILINLLSVNGIEMMTPFPVPTHKRLQDTIRAVILTNENPSFPVPETSMQHSLKNIKKTQIFRDYETFISSSFCKQENQL